MREENIGLDVRAVDGLAAITLAELLRADQIHGDAGQVRFTNARFFTTVFPYLDVDLRERRDMPPGVVENHPVGGHRDADIMAEVAQSPWKRPGNISQSAYFGERGDFGGDEQNLHGDEDSDGSSRAVDSPKIQKPHIAQVEPDLAPGQSLQ